MTGYREAKKKIEEAWRDGDVELSLRGLDLSEVPPSIGKLTSLLTLNLDRNHLITLPDSFDRLTELKSLDLSGNHLTVLPSCLTGLIQLQSLDLHSNQLTTIPEFICEFRRLQSLFLGQNQLTSLPQSLSRLTQLQSLHFNHNYLTELPDWLSHLIHLTSLNGTKNQLVSIPDSFTQLTNLSVFAFGGNKIGKLPNWVSRLSKLSELYFWGHELENLPEWIGGFVNLKILNLDDNNLVDLPHSLVYLEELRELSLDRNPLNPELAEAYKQGLDAVRTYLRTKAAAQITLNEAKLILVGEGEVGKTCLMDALLGKSWQEHSSTHGIAIEPIQISNPDGEEVITLNGWDFGGQRVYRPTHQLFFSSPAVYLVVWKPREGPQQGFVKEWIQLIKRREPNAKILVVATHGGPQQRQPDIDRQELWDLFGRGMVIDFLLVDSKPDDMGERRNIEELKRAIARVAMALPEVGRSVPKRWQDVRDALKRIEAPSLPFIEVLELCRNYQMDEEEAQLFVTIEHRLGHLIHYEHDPILRDLVVLKPDWLATDISFVLDDEMTRKAHGLVRHSRLSELWSDPTRNNSERYPLHLHPIFIRLMERFDLSYRVADPTARSDSDPQSLIAQLVPDVRPDLISGWVDYPAEGNLEQLQICRIVDARNSQSATAEGLFYQLIVRLHKYSLGRVDHVLSVHWQRGLVLDDEYNGRALLEHVGNDIRITVRAPYPQRFLAMLTEEVKYLVESFWEGLRCDVTVPCLNPNSCIGLFEVRKLIENLKRDRLEQPCPICNEWQPIDKLLHNAPAAQPNPTAQIFAEFTEVKAELNRVRSQLAHHGQTMMGRFDGLDEHARRTLSRVDGVYTDLLQIFLDEAKEGPRLFSLVPVNRTVFNPRQWTSAKFRLVLWCEHSRLPLPTLNGKNSKKGVYELELTRAWFKKAAPFLKVVTGALSLALPIASSGIKLALDETAYKAIEEQLDFGKDVIDASLDTSEKVGVWLSSKDDFSLEHGDAIRANGAILRELQSILKAKDSSFGGLVRVLNKQQKFLWVHPQFEKEY